MTCANRVVLSPMIISHVGSLGRTTRGITGSRASLARAVIPSVPLWSQRAGKKRGTARQLGEQIGSRRIIRQIPGAAMSNFVTLLVEDDMLQRELVASALRNEGFEVVECATAEAGEVIVTSTGVDLQALIVDQNLAGAMKGADLAAYARARYPRLNIILISGDRVRSIPHGTVFLQKPFQPERLLAAVRQ